MTYLYGVGASGGSGGVSSTSPLEPTEPIGVYVSESVVGRWPALNCGLGVRPLCPRDQDGRQGSFGLAYGINQTRLHLCHVSLFRASAEAVGNAVRAGCVYKLIVSGHEVHARLGVVLHNKSRIFTHYQLTVSHSQKDGRVTGVSLRQTRAVPYDAGDIAYSYSANWVQRDEDQDDEEEKLNKREHLSSPFINTLILLAFLAYVSPSQESSSSGTASASGAAAAAGTRPGTIGAVLLSACAGAGVHAFIALALGRGWIVATAALCGIVARTCCFTRLRSPGWVRGLVPLISGGLIAMLHGLSFGEISLSVLLCGTGYVAEHFRRSRCSRRSTVRTRAFAHFPFVGCIVTFCAVSPHVLELVRAEFTYHGTTGVTSASAGATTTLEGIGLLGALACIGAVMMAGRTTRDTFYGFLTCFIGGVLSCVYVLSGVVLLGISDIKCNSLIRLCIELCLGCGGLGALGSALRGSSGASATSSSPTL